MPEMCHRRQKREIVEKKLFPTKGDITDVVHIPIFHEIMEFEK